jgi:hypothetical protein
LLQRVVSRKIGEQNERVHMKRRKYKATNKRDTRPSSVSSKEHDPDKMLTTTAVAFSKTSRNTDMVQVQDIYPCLLCQSAMAWAISAEGKKKNLRTNGLSRHQMRRKSSLKWIRIYRSRVCRTQD